MAQEQARAELMASVAAGGWSTNSGGGGGGSGTAGQDAPAASPEALAAFLTEQGLGRRDAERLAERLAAGAGGDSSSSSSGGGGSGMSLERLQAKWAALQRVLPEMDVAAIAAREPALLAADSGALVGRLVALVAALPGRSVRAIVEARPGLLLLEVTFRSYFPLLPLPPSHAHREPIKTCPPFFLPTPSLPAHTHTHARRTSPLAASARWPSSRRSTPRATGLSSPRSSRSTPS